MIDKIEINQPHKFVEKPRESQPNSQNNKLTSDSAKLRGPAELQVSYTELINKAKKAKNDDSAVQKARKLLENEMLDTPQNCEKAAENIIKFGI